MLGFIARFSLAAVKEFLAPHIPVAAFGSCYGKPYDINSCSRANAASTNVCAISIKCPKAMPMSPTSLFYQTHRTPRPAAISRIACSIW
jgi:hypothetical protein